MDRRARVAALYAASAALAVAGFLEFRFLTDDAYISFRYASNALAGRGLTWNPPPFLPIEGYTNFAWVILLGGVWAALGIEPPDAANGLSLTFGLGTLALVFRIGLRMALPARIEPVRIALLALVVLGVVANRTYLAWLSSGLETALFNFALTAWVAAALESASLRGALGTLAISTSAALAALTRPDGWLAVAGCLPLAATTLRRPEARSPRRLAAWLPLALPAVHVLWRHGYYGEWLPNTWFAKQNGAWPEAGLRYAASFALEYALFVWLACAAFWLARRPSLGIARATVLAVLGAHFVYYTLIIGGDHFEYRVYSHTVPFWLLSAAWMVAAGGASPRVVVAAVATFVLLSLPIPWTHHFATRDLTLRAQTHKLFTPVAPRLPGLMSPWTASFDALQAWLIPRHVGMRHREHAVYHEQLIRSLPTREEGSRISWDERAVLLAGNVGVIGWVFPNVAVIDVLGLNDYTVARTPVPEGGERAMAHERLAPPDYLACYAPNLSVVLPRSYRFAPRERPLTDERIAACEREWRARAGEPIAVPAGMEIERR